jgi:hypothetical protein
MPKYCVGTDPNDYSDRKVHDLTCGVCPYLPIEQYRDHLGWHADLQSAVFKAKFWFKTAKPCAFCLMAATKETKETNDGQQERY